MSVHLITGAGSGIGAAVARALHERGDELWLLARSAERAAELSDAFPGAHTIVADLADPDVAGDALRACRSGSTRCTTSPGWSSWSRWPRSTRPRCARRST